MRNGSNVCDAREDYQADGVHPAQGALDQIATMIHERLRAEDWYAQ